MRESCARAVGTHTHTPTRLSNAGAAPHDLNGIQERQTGELCWRPCVCVYVCIAWLVAAV